MKHLLTVAAISTTLFFSSCGNAADNATDNTTSTTTSEVKVENPGKMNELMALLDGNHVSSKKAIETYFSDSLKSSLEESNNASFGDYDLLDAKVVSVDGQCCVMEAKAGVTTRSYKLCWQDDKVTSIEDLGIK